MTIYRDISNLGIQKLHRLCKKFYVNSDHSFTHNIKVIRLELKRWANTVINVGNLIEWKNLANGLSKDKELKNVCLWMDSSDFALKGKSRDLHNDRYWSYKCNSIGRRFQCVFTANQKLIAIWGGYSPKVIDNIWIEIHKQELSDKFKNATIIADGHYWSSRDCVTNVRFVAPKPNRNNLTEVDKKRNKNVRNLRARVEAPFGQIKQRFRALSGTFMGDHEQLECCVFYAFAINNLLLK